MGREGSRPGPPIFPRPARIPDRPTDAPFITKTYASPMPRPGRFAHSCNRFDTFWFQVFARFVRWARGQFGGSGGVAGRCPWCQAGI